MNAPHLAQSDPEHPNASLRPQDLALLRTDGLVEPRLPPMTMCGGLQAPYRVTHASAPSALLPTLSASAPQPSSAAE